MPPQDAGDELQQALWGVVGRLDGGNWRAVVQNSGFIGHAAAGPGHLVRWASALGLITLSMQAQAEGRVHDAWDRLDKAAALLPPQLVRRDRYTAAVHAVLQPMPPDAAPLEMRLVVRIARLVWREQRSSPT